MRELRAFMEDRTLGGSKQQLKSHNEVIYPKIPGKVGDFGIFPSSCVASLLACHELRYCQNTSATA